MVKFLISLAVGLCLTASAYAQSAFYGAAYIGSSGPATLYSIDPATGAATAIGPIGFNRVSGLDFAPNRVLYGVGSDGGGNAVLITINTTTGAGTLVGPLGFAGTAQDIAFRPDGVLFAYIGGEIETINTTTGAATVVGNTGGFPDGNGLAFQANTLYLGNDGGDLQTVNQGTGAVTTVAPFTYGAGFGGSDRPSGMKFDPSSGVLYAAITEGFTPATGWFFASINVATGVVTDIGSTVNGLDAIAILAPAGAGATQVPALSPWSMLALIALVLAAGLVPLSRLVVHRRK
jgi:hypothetical protein